MSFKMFSNIFLCKCTACNIKRGNIYTCSKKRHRPSMLVSVCNQTLRYILSSSLLIAMVVVNAVVLLFAYFVSKHMKIKVSPMLAL